MQMWLFYERAGIYCRRFMSAYSNTYDEIIFIEWNGDSLVCDTGIFSKKDLYRHMGEQ